MKHIKFSSLLLLFFLFVNLSAQNNISPANIKFVRQGAQRLIFNEDQAIHLASLHSKEVIGLNSMYPIDHYSTEQANITIDEGKLFVLSMSETETAIWFAGFNPFATYTLDLASCKGKGEFGFEFSDATKTKQTFITIEYSDEQIINVKFKVVKDGAELTNESIATNIDKANNANGKYILQMLGSGMVLYLQQNDLPLPIGQCEFPPFIDLRKISYINSFQSKLYAKVKSGWIKVNNVESVLSTGMGLADIRAITYEDGKPFFDQGKLWYTMSIRGRALPHHIQGIFSLEPSVFNLKLEGIVVFDRNDGLLRNEIASHIFFDRDNNIWRGLTTGFSAYAIPGEKKQLLVVESKKDPRFGFSIMKAEPFGIVGDIEDPHILFDPEAGKWRILTCENHDGYKAVMLESDTWNKGYKEIAGPVKYNSTGTSIQKIGNKRYCFSGSSEREIYIYTYPELNEAGTLKMDLPPWDESAGTRVWPNVVEMPEGYPFKYIALMMDRYNYPGLVGRNWTYGAIYLYHGYE